MPIEYSKWNNLAMSDSEEETNALPKARPLSRASAKASFAPSTPQQPRLKSFSRKTRQRIAHRDKVHMARTQRAESRLPDSLVEAARRRDMSIADIPSEIMEAERKNDTGRANIIIMTLTAQYTAQRSDCRELMLGIERVESRVANSWVMHTFADASVARVAFTRITCLLSELLKQPAMVGSFVSVTECITDPRIALIGIAQERSWNILSPSPLPARVIDCARALVAQCRSPQINVRCAAALAGVHMQCLITHAAKCTDVFSEIKKTFAEGVHDVEKRKLDYF